ncbi:hypothetical protein ZEAMMB73_Zm00001d031369 [Zea mays]|uniref:Replication factor A C-terminal domain-containing protein n=1 Tax=Zea mays TaxID=4577 RepID=A0A1D6KIG7_MAIZE|nr:hypothetical protein ZEAMMB73_Zm00001d031369 [Zea mays]
MINEVSEINPIQLSGKSSIYRNVFIKNLSNDIIKVTLWGNQALKFSYEAIYDQKIQHVVVVLFVGCLPKEYKGSVYLSGGAACHWYFNPSINEAQPYYQRDIFHVSKNYTIHNENVTIKLPPLTNEQAAFVSPPETQHKDLKELLESEPLTLPEEGFKCTVTITRLLDDQPWWYKACNTCPNKPSMRSSVSSCPTCGSTDAIIRYKLNFMATDDTAEMLMFCFDNVAKRIIGKTCTSLLTSVTDASNIRPDLAAIVSLKFTFVVVYNLMSFQNQEKELLIKSVIASHGRDLSLPSTKLSIPMHPSTPTKLLSRTRQAISPSTALSNLSTSISLEQHSSFEAGDSLEDQNPQSFESPPKRTKHKSLRFDCGEDATNKDQCMIISLISCTV